MTVDQAILKSFLHAKRKTVLPTGNKYAALLAIADSMQKMWAAEPDTDWGSRFELITIGTVTATDTFELDEEIDYISQDEDDDILLTDDTSTTTVKLVAPKQLYKYRDEIAAARIGVNLKFSKAFVSTDSVLGYDIRVPSYTFTDDITVGTQDVQVDDPMWLVYMMAAEYVRNDSEKQDQYDSLVGLATVHMEKMKQRNGSQYNVISTPWAATGETWA